MKKTLLGFVVVALAVVAYRQQSPSPAAPPAAPPHARPAEELSRSSVEDAFRNRSDGVDVQGAGTVAAVLPDDAEGSRHQRFLVRLASGQTLLISHNVDLAPRVPVRVGDSIAFRGEYVWNPKGGLVHWTHRDPAAHHTAGWLRRNGRTFQ